MLVLVDSLAQTHILAFVVWEASVEAWVVAVALSCLLDLDLGLPAHLVALAILYVGPVVLAMCHLRVHEMTVLFLGVQIYGVRRVSQFLRTS